MGLFSREKPKINQQPGKKDGFSGWLKCAHCHELLHDKELDDNLKCCPKCGFHYRLPVFDRIKNLIDEGTFTELFSNILPQDALHFVDSESYAKRLEEAAKKSTAGDSIVVGTGAIKNRPVAFGVMDFNFMGGSMGSVVGERITRLIEYAIEKNLPVIIVCSSGGARMQESVLSLMQMAKTSAALAQLGEKGLPYISVLTNPTTGGVTASFASLGDVIVAEPDALICFAGPRVIEQTTGLKLPPGAQRSEFLVEHGMVDCIVKRAELKDRLADLLFYFAKGES